MKAWEICKKENLGKKYEDSNGQEGTVFECNLKNGGFGDDVCYDLLNRSEGVLITTKYYMSIISELDFEEVIDWSKVPVDTKILVRDSKTQSWVHRHFAEYEDGKVFAWGCGKTSFTSCMEEVDEWGYVKLYKEGE